jgi:hypothetical protein
MSRWVVRLLTGALLCAAILAGCGGSGDDPLTKAEFVKRADAICARGERTKDTALEAFFREHQQQLQKSDEEDLVTEVALPPIQTMTGELADLSPPADEKETTGAIVGGYEAAVREIERDPAIVISSTASPFAKANKLAARYGLKTCAEL